MGPHSGGGVVSVILPAYNEAQYIREALQSVLDQTYPFIEVIVVDDGSTDGTSRVVEEFTRCDTRVRLIRQENKGVGDARNTAIMHASGAYIAPIDADDRWNPDKLEKQVACIESRGIDTGLVYCWYRSINSDGKVLGYSQPHDVEGRAARAMLLRNLMGNASVPLFRATALQSVGLYLSRTEQGGAQGFEDWDLGLRVSEKFDVGVVRDYLVDYRQTPNCMSTNARSMASSFTVVIRRARKRNPHVPRHEFRWSTGNFYYYMTRRSFAWYRYGACVECLARAILADPLHLLNINTYRMVGRSLLHALSGGRLVHTRRMQTTNGNPIAARKTISDSPVGQRTFGRIQSKRWSAVLAETAGSDR